MKLHTIFTLLSLLFITLSCRDASIPEDIHEHEEIEMVTLTLTDTENPANIQTVQYVGGNADKRLVLRSGASYRVAVDFMHRHDGDLESMLEEIIEEKDEHFITYEFAGIGVEVERTAEDIARTDGNRLGVHTLWKVNSAPSSALVSLKLFHGSSSVDMNFPSASNQQGKAVGGEADVNMQVRID